MTRSARRPRTKVSARAKSRSCRRLFSTGFVFRHEKTDAGAEQLPHRLMPGRGEEPQRTAPVVATDLGPLVGMHYHPAGRLTPPGPATTTHRARARVPSGGFIEHSTSSRTWIDDHRQIHPGPGYWRCRLPTGPIRRWRITGCVDAAQASYRLDSTLSYDPRLSQNKSQPPLKTDVDPQIVTSRPR